MKLSPIKYPGGKSYQARQIRLWMPKHIHYVEPFFGGGSVLFSGDGEGVSELINDINGDVVNFFRVLRDDGQELKDKLSLTPFARDEFSSAFNSSSFDPVERARSFFIQCRQSRTGMGKDFVTPVRSRTRGGMSDPVSAWLGSIDGLDWFVRRLKRVLIENMDACDLIQREDRPGVHIYCDPPYYHDTRTSKELYENEFYSTHHIDLLAALKSIKHATWQLSGYDNELYRRYESKCGWHRREIKIDNKMSSKRSKAKVTEVVWSNYAVEEQS